MLFWALLNLRVLLRAPAKRAMRGRAVHACSPIDAALSSTDATKNPWMALFASVYMTLAPARRPQKKPHRYAKTLNRIGHSRSNAFSLRELSISCCAVAA